MTRTVLVGEKMSENSKDKYRNDRKMEIVDTRAIRELLLGQGFCVLCGHDDPLDLEKNHIGLERNNPSFVVSLCRNCHGRVSRKQRFWPKESLDRQNAPRLANAFVFKGLAELFEMKSKRILQEYGIA